MPYEECLEVRSKWKSRAKTGEMGTFITDQKGMFGVKTVGAKIWYFEDAELNFGVKKRPV